MKSRGFWRAPRHLVLLVEDGKINVGDLGLLTLIGLDGGERDGFHVATWGALAATSGESERHVRRRLERLCSLDLIRYEQPGAGARHGFRIFLGSAAAVPEPPPAQTPIGPSVPPSVKSDPTEVVAYRTPAGDERFEPDRTSPWSRSTETEKKERSREVAGSMKEEDRKSQALSDLTQGDDALAELVRNLRDADQWTERSFRKLFGQLPQEDFGQVLHELRKRRTRSDLGPLRSESAWAHDRLTRLDFQQHEERGELPDLSF